jgi:threonine/homoserine/homoserine lactone efflux protein
MILHFLIRGLIIGFSIAAPVGPIGVLCIRRTLAEGRSYGLAAGLGAATADALYGSIAGFGLTFISNFLIGQQLWLRLIGGTFLCYWGIKTFLSPPFHRELPAEGRSLLSAYGSTLLLTLTNPMTILSFAAIFAGLGIGSVGRDYLSATILVLWVFIGSGFWWFILSTGVSLFQKKFDPRGLRWVNRISGFIILGFGILAFWGTLKKS